MKRGLLTKLVEKVNRLLPEETFLLYTDDSALEAREGRPPPVDLPLEGRLGLHVRNRELQFAWNILAPFCGARVKVDLDNGEAQLHAALPPVSFWLTVGGFWGLARAWRARGLDGEARELSWTLHDSMLSWKLWAKSNSWSNRTPRWRDGSLNLTELVLGKSVYRKTVVRECQVTVPMPEKHYPAKAILFDSGRYYPRFGFFDAFPRRVTVEVEGDGIPGGKNGPVSSQTTPARSIGEGVGDLVGYVLKYRGPGPVTPDGDGHQGWFRMDS